MGKTKKRMSQLLALCMAAILVFSSFGSVAAVAATATGVASSNDCGIGSSSGYTVTGSLSATDKSSDTQKNYQSATTTSATYTTSLLQSAEWTNKATGEAAIKIHYEADFGTTSTTTTTAETRSLYVFTNSTDSSGFAISQAVNNIQKLLTLSDYVDVVVIITGQIGRASGSGRAASHFTVALMFSVCADDNLNSTQITNIFSQTSDTALKNLGYTYGLGQTKESGTSGSFDELYANTSYTLSYLLPVPSTSQRYDNYWTYSDFIFGGGAFFSIYYIQKYYDIIEENYGESSFNTTVKYIVNSFDGLLPAIMGGFVAYEPTYLYNAMNTYMGLNVRTASDLTGLQNTCGDAVSVIRDYDTKGRYIVLTPADSYTDCYELDSDLQSSISSGESLTGLVNALTCMMFLIDPTGTWGNESSVKSTLTSYLNRSYRNPYRYTTTELGTISYSTGLSNLADFSMSSSRTITITATITSEFEVDESAITVTNVSGTGSSFTYTVNTASSSGNTVVTIAITDLTTSVDEWTIDVSIPVKLKSTSTSFYANTDDFKDTNVANTTVYVVKSYTTNNPSGTTSTDTISETVTVASPKLYRTVGSLTISKTVAGDNADTSQEFTFTVSLGSVTGSFSYTGSNGAASGTISFTSGVASTTITLKHGQSITISGLPANTTYTVTETNVSTEDWTTTVNGGNEQSTSATGTISANATSTVAFTNTAVEATSVSQDFNLSINVGGSVNLATYLANYYSGTYTFDSCNVSSSSGSGFSRSGTTVTGTTAGESGTVVVVASSSTVELTATFNITVLAAETGFSDTIYVNVGETESVSVTGSSYFGASAYSDYDFDSYSVTTAPTSGIATASLSGTTLSVNGVSAGTTSVVVTATSSTTGKAVVGTFNVSVNKQSVSHSENITINVGGGVNLGDYITASSYGNYTFTSYTTSITSGSGYVSLSGTNNFQVTGTNAGTATVQVVASSSTVELTATFNITVSAAETGPSDTITIAVGETTKDLTSYFTSYSDYSLDGYSAAISTGGDSFIELSSDSSFTAGSYVIKYTGKSAGTATVTVTATSSTTGKAVVGTFNIEVEATTFALTIYKYTGADEDTGTPLENAQFSVEKVNTADSTTEEFTTGTTNSNGEIIISGLELDTIYKISETKVPSGYVLADPIYIKVVNDSGTLVGYVIDPTTWDTKSGTSSMSCDYTPASNSSLTTFVVKIQNTQLESMPQTGFSGALLVFAAGGAIVATGFYVLFGRKSKLARAAHASRL